ncbi:hypothetical protein ACFPRL_32615 [Pseudoclavibacter helvolus]
MSSCQHYVTVIVACRCQRAHHVDELVRHDFELTSAADDRPRVGQSRVGVSPAVQCRMRRATECSSSASFTGSPELKSRRLHSIEFSPRPSWTARAHSSSPAPTFTVKDRFRPLVNQDPLETVAPASLNASMNSARDSAS